MEKREPVAGIEAGQIVDSMNVPVTKRALIQRLQRALKAEGKSLRIARANRFAVLGRYYIIGPNGVVETNVNLKDLAQRMELLEPWETLIEVES
jgi:hypothetical protein